MNELEQTPMTIQDYYDKVYPFDKGAETQIDKGGYVKVHLPNHPMNFQGYVLLHRAVMEQAIGRFLYPCEQVHHIDRNRENNDITNLQLYATQRNHLIAEHSNSIFRKDDVVQAVLKSADDPNVSLNDLPCSPVTARKILTHYEKKWVSPATWKGCSEEELRSALKLVGKQGLAKHFGVTYQTIWRRFPHILVERKTPNFLDKHHEEVCKLLLDGLTFRQIATHFETSVTTISATLLRWSTNGDLPIAVVRNVNARPTCKLRL